MSKTSVAKKLASKLSQSKAEKILAKYDTVEAATALKGSERQQYLEALDTVYGDRSKRAKDLGFSDETYYHGTNKSFEQFDPKLADSRRKTGVPESSMVFADKPEVANSYADQHTSGFTGEKSWQDTGGQVYPVQLNLGKSKSFNAKGENWNSIYDPVTKDDLTTNDLISIAKEKGKNSAVIKNVKDRGEGYGPAEKASTVAVFEPNQIRSTNAAFDPRFKDSADILAIAGSNAPKIAARMIKPQMNLGDAFSTITEPIEKVDKPVNDVIDKIGKKFGQLTDLTGGKDTAHQERAEAAFNTAAGFIAPTPSNILMSGITPVKVAAKMVKPAAQKSAAELYREAKALQKSSDFGKVVVKEAPKPNFGSVTVKP
jgi:hypothetical protein